MPLRDRLRGLKPPKSKEEATSPGNKADNALQTRSQNKLSTPAAELPSLPTVTALNLRAREGDGAPPETISTKTVKLYWEMAAAKLEVEDSKASSILKRIRSQDENASNKLPETLLQSIKEHRTRLEQQRWKLPFKLRGKEIVIRDCLDTIMKGVLVMKDIGSSLAAFEPIYVGIAWAGINFVLNIALNNVEQYTGALHDLSKISSIIARYAQVEIIYLKKRDVSLIPDLERCLIDLYMNILKHQTMLIQRFEKNTLNRTFDATIGTGKDWVSSFTAIQSLDVECRAQLQVLDGDAIQNASKKLQSINTTLSTMQDFLVQTEIRDVLNWVTPVSAVDTHDSILGSVSRMGSDYAHTCRWLFDDSTFHAWFEHNAKRNALWLRAPVGRGKTSLMSKVIEWHIEKCFLQKEPRPIAYFYCSRTPFDTVLRSLLRQLVLSEDGAAISKPVMDAYGSGHVSLSFQQTLDLLVVLISASSNTTIIVDALDECIEYDNLLRHLRNLSKKCSNLMIMVSSRDHVPVADYLDCDKINVTPEKTLTDLTNYVHNEIFEREPHERLLKGRFPKLEKEMRDVLCERAEGMFQWVRLQLTVLFSSKLERKNQMKLPENVKERIESLRERVWDSKLDSVYDEIFDMNTAEDTSNRQDAIKALKFALCSFRPVTFKELAQAISLRPDGSIRESISAAYIRDITSNFLVPGHGKSGRWNRYTVNVVTFAHESVREYLERKQHRGVFEFSPIEAHSQTAELCLNLLSNLDSPLVIAEFEMQQLSAKWIQEEEDDRWSWSWKLRGFDGYCLKYCFIHCQSANLSHSQVPANLLLKTFLSRPCSAGLKIYLDLLSEIVALKISTAIETKQRIWFITNVLSTPYDPIFAAVMFGFTDICISLTRDNIAAEFGPCNILGTNTLFLACEFENTDVLKHQLVVYPGELNLNSCKNVPSKDLRSVINLDVKIDGYYPSTPNIETRINPIQMAVVRGSSKIFEVLIEHGADVLTKSSQTRILHIAVEGGHEALAGKILDAVESRRAADPHLTWFSTGNLRHESRSDVVELTKAFSPKPFIEWQDDRGRTALEVAILENHSRIVALLLGRGASYNPGILLDNVEYMSMSMISVLMQCGISVAYKTDDMLNKLVRSKDQRAIKYVLGQLTAEEIVFNKQNLLLKAIDYGSTVATAILLDSGDIHLACSDAFKNLALLKALVLNSSCLTPHDIFLRKLQMLINHGVKLSDQDASGKTILLLASENAEYFGGRFQYCSSRFKALLDFGASAAECDYDGNNVLHLSLISAMKTKGRLSMSQYLFHMREAHELLLRNGASVHQKNIEGQTPLDYLMKLARNSDASRGGQKDLLVDAIRFFLHHATKGSQEYGNEVMPCNPQVEQLQKLLENLETPGYILSISKVSKDRPDWLDCFSYTYAARCPDICEETHEDVEAA